MTIAASNQRRPRRRPFSGVGGSLIAFVLLFCAMFFGVSWLLSPEPDVGAAGPVALGEREGREVVVIAYSRDGPRGMFQLLFQPMFQSRLTAIDTETGDRVWDVRLDEELGNDMRVLAAADGLVYVASDRGLYIRSLADGSPVAQPEAIPGLGDRYVAELGSYDVDLDRELVVAIDQDGGLWQIPFGEAIAVSADAVTATSWQQQLSDEFRFALHLPETADEASLSGGATIAGAPTKPGARTESLVVSNGSPRVLGESTFLEPRFVLDGTVGAREQDVPRAAGAGYVLVVSKLDANAEDYTVSSIDLDSGAVIDATNTAIGYTVRGGYGNGGVTAVVVESETFEADRLLIAAADGTITTATIGASNFFGWPA